MGLNLTGRFEVPVEILVRGLREKPNANSPVFLADWMLLPATSISGRVQP